VPCVNGILKVGSIVHGFPHCMGLQTVAELHFDGRSQIRRPFAVLTALDTSTNVDITMRMPAVHLKLQNEDYMKGETSDILRMSCYSDGGTHVVDKAFAVFSSVKRAVGLSRAGGRCHMVTLAVSTAATKTLFGLPPNGRTKQQVRITFPFPGLQNLSNFFGTRFKKLNLINLIFVKLKFNLINVKFDKNANKT
jgi:uncharacterized protein YjhX (UPF0386 family)